MPLPRITIVTPSYNQARYVGWTVRSVLLQDYPNLEYIVMDGGSDDATLDVLAPYAGRFAHLAHGPDKGQADAIHRGFARSTGDIMAYLNSDDMLAPGALSFVADFFAAHPDVDMVYSHRCTVDDGNVVRWYWVLPPHDDWYQSRWDMIPQETCFWRRRLFEKCGNVDPTLQFAIDYDLFVRFMRSGARLVRADRFLAAFREHDAAKTTRLVLTVGADEAAMVRKRYGIEFGRLDVYRGVWFHYGAYFWGRSFARKKQSLPGCLAGVGYNYDKVWGGRLGDGRLPRPHRRS